MQVCHGQDGWGSTKPPSYAFWSCRETPWRRPCTSRESRKLRSPEKASSA
ncbi:unnamed protein product [Symbiodinium necroappetens]|uniref:Uncharacterized protein n=1 Tax=Symbiodinium necroappetens TaxID=1628268 RepID=A0A812U7J4_9DINO|nr:unnamed protein product [Symbiodinium necroappetens]CAE7905641.1 unnamed protein product [Symbiodinium microadriaticum]